MQIGRHIGKIALGVVANLLLACGAQAAATWDYYLYTGVAHRGTILLQRFAEEVKKRTDGELIIRVYPAGELPFKATEVVKITGDGQVQMGSASPGFIAGSVAIGTVGNHYGLIGTYDEMNKVLPIINKYADPHFQKNGAKILFAWSWPTQHIFGSGKPIRTLDDFAGRKIRTVAPQEAEMLKRLGASSLALTTPEIAVALERKMMDGLITAPMTIVASKLSDFLSWIYVSNLHMGGPNYELVNVKAYDALAPNVRAKLDEVAKEWGPLMNREVEAGDNEDMKLLIEKNKLEPVKARPEDLEALRKKMDDYADSWAKETGPDAVAMMKEIRATLGR
jgi:TRAP-type C4-dicarboxylate transport system substrate-binding protein